MSTIIRDAKGNIWLYTKVNQFFVCIQSAYTNLLIFVVQKNLTKGAESHVFPLCRTTTPSQMELIKITQQHIDDFARLGLRTLAVAKRKLTVEEYQTFDIGDQISNTRITSRQIISKN